MARGDTLRALLDTAPGLALSHVEDIRSLVGLLSKSGDMGLFVTSGTFSTDADRFARDSHIHVRLINLDDFIQLWQEFYPKLNDEEKNMLPLHRLYFLGANE